MIRGWFWATLVAAIIGSAAARAQSVEFGALGIDADGPVYIALDKGYFHDAGNRSHSRAL